MRQNLTRAVTLLTAFALVLPPPVFAQPNPPAAAEAGATEFNLEQLDAMLAPIALYPDELLTQLLMAATYPLQVVAAARWLGADNQKSLKGNALVKALEKENWDPSVKSLVPFPQVLEMLNSNLEWTQQLGYAMATQQAAVFDSTQRLRRQAQTAGSLKTTEQQKVIVEKETVIIQPANPEVVYVPSYQPAKVYGDWPYPSYPPVYFPPPAAYYPPGYVFGAGIAFGLGVAAVGGLWGWARPGWGYGNVNINTGIYNNININRGQINNGVWRPPAGGIGGRPIRPPGGPIGAPARPTQLPTNAIGRNAVQVNNNALNRANISFGNRTNVGNVQRPAGGQATQRPAQLPQRPGGGEFPSAAQRQAGGQAPQRPGGGERPAVAQRPGAGQILPAAQRPAGTFGGLGDGSRASQYSARGNQSVNFQQRVGAGGGFQGRATGGGGFRRR